MLMEKATLFKKKKSAFKKQCLEKILSEITQNVEKKKKHNANILADWQRGGKIYFVAGQSIDELSNNRKFEDEADLKSFFAEHLLNQIEDPLAKKILLEVCFLGLHQGGFAHAFGISNAILTTHCFKQRGVFYGNAKKKVNFSGLKRGIQINEYTVCRAKIDEAGNESVTKGIFYQTNSRISVILVPIKNLGYRLKTVVNEVLVDCETDELKPYFFKQSRAPGASVERWLSSLIAFIKRCWDRLTCFKSANEVLLDQDWLNRPYALPKGKITASILVEAAASKRRLIAAKEPANEPYTPASRSFCSRFWSGFGLNCFAACPSDDPQLSARSANANTVTRVSKVVV